MNKNQVKVSEGEQQGSDRSNPYSEALNIIKAFQPSTQPPYILDEVKIWRRLIRPMKMIEPIHIHLNITVTELGNLAKRGVVLPNRMAARWTRRGVR